MLLFSFATQSFICLLIYFYNKYLLTLYSVPCLNYREGGRHNSCVLLVILFYSVKSCVKRLEDGGSFEEWFSSSLVS